MSGTGTSKQVARLPAKRTWPVLPDEPEDKTMIKHQMSFLTFKKVRQPEGLCDFRYGNPNSAEFTPSAELIAASADMSEKQIISGLVPLFDVGRIENQFVQNHNFYSKSIDGLKAKIPVEGKEVDFDLMPFQRQSLGDIVAAYNIGRRGYEVFDFAGFGKYVQIFSFLLVLPKIEKKPHLLVVPKTSLQKWKKDFDDFLTEPRPRVLWFHKSMTKDLENLTAEQIQQHDVVVTTYNVLGKCQTEFERCRAQMTLLSMTKKVRLQDAEARSLRNTTKEDLKFSGVWEELERLEYDLLSVQWNILCCDEWHYSTNVTTKASRFLHNTAAKFRLGVTATPQGKRNRELFRLLD